MGRNYVRVSKAQIRDYECPKCGAVPGEFCRGRDDGASHRERMTAAQIALDPDRKPVAESKLPEGELWSVTEEDDEVAAPAPKATPTPKPAPARAAASSGGFTPTDEQVHAVDLALAGEPMAVEALAGTGKTSTLKLIAEAKPERGLYVAFNKALRWDQPVATPDGWVPIEKLKVGDEVLGRDGASHRVLKVIDRGLRPMNLVRFSDGTEVVADDEHLWEVERTDTGNTTYRHGGVVTTTELADHLAARRRVRVPTTDALVLAEAEVPVDPWLLGILLGDGSVTNGKAWLCSADEWIIDAAEAALPAGVTMKPVAGTAQRTARTVAFVGAGGVNPLLAALRTLGVYGGVASTKRVPDLYLWASAAQRLAVLQGLMDTDGCAGAQGVTPIFTTTSEGLADDVAFLACSLGGAASKRLMRGPTDRWAAAWQVTVRLPVGVIPFRFPGKVARLRPRSHDRLLRRRVVAVEPLPADRAVCIAIDAPDRLFLTAGLVPTHNSIVEEAKRKFPDRVTCSTSHSLAYKQVGRKYAHRLNGRRMRSLEIARRLQIRPMQVTTPVGSKWLPPDFIAGMVMKGIRSFCLTADPEPHPSHIPTPDTLRDDPMLRQAFNGIRYQLEDQLRWAWADVQKIDGELPFDHNAYLKLWQLQGPFIPTDYILFDEAQDANGVTLAIVEAQADHAQLVFVGDRYQQIYAWNGAVNAMEKVQVTNRAWLTRSFRFGPQIAEAANEVLGLLGGEKQVEGAGPAGARGECEQPDILLSRSNAQAVTAALEEIEAGGRPHVIGGADDVVGFAEAADKLQRGESTTHPDLVCFDSWSEVEHYVKQDELGSDLALLVSMCNEFGAAELARILRHQPAEADATLILSTAHKSKGREWPVVKLHGGLGASSGDEELRLRYVATTRAIAHLDDVAVQERWKALMAEEGDADRWAAYDDEEDGWDAEGEDAEGALLAPERPADGEVVVLGPYTEAGAQETFLATLEASAEESGFQVVELGAVTPEALDRVVGEAVGEIHHSATAVPSAQEALGLLEALAPHCEHFTRRGAPHLPALVGDANACIRSGRVPDAEYGADRSCWPCTIHAIAAGWWPTKEDPNG